MAKRSVKCSRRHSHRLRHSAGLTLVEMMMALGLTALITAAVASMMVTVSHGVSSRSDIRSLVIRQKTVTGRIASIIRESEAVMASGDDYLLLWTYDENDDGAANIAELRLIRHNAATNELAVHQLDLSATSAAAIELMEANLELPIDFAMDLLELRSENQAAPASWATTFDELAEEILDADYFPPTRLAGNIGDCTFALRGDDRFRSTVISFQITLLDDSVTDVAVASATLRNGGLH